MWYAISLFLLNRICGYRVFIPARRNIVPPTAKRASLVE